MSPHERALRNFLALADKSQRLGQLAGRDRLLVLAAAAACRSGWPDVAERCRTFLLAHNRRHIVGRFDSFVGAIQDDDFLTFLKQLERTCGYERTEHLAAELDVGKDEPTGEWIERVFASEHWGEDERAG